MNIYLHRSLADDELEQAWSAFQADLARDTIRRGHQVRELGDELAAYFCGVLRREIEADLAETRLS